jgi:hypothetical protein
MKNYCNKFLLLLFFFILSARGLKSQVTDSVKAGSFIINMGITPQVISKALRPYGMVFEMVNYYKIPVKWIINPAKILYGTDFIHNAITYKGGTFVIPAEYLTPAVIARINTFWVTGQGVAGSYAVSNFEVHGVYMIEYMPKITFDTDNGNIARKYFDDAQFDIALLPAGQASYYVNKTPGQLDACDNIYYMPHADPTWAVHGNIRNWVINSKGYYWGACHATSVMESVVNPLNLTQKMNFLTDNGLQCYGNGKCNLNTEVHAGNPVLPAAINTATSIASHPLGQFMSDPFGATINGSEQWFIPLTAGAGWRTTTLNFGATNNYAVAGSQVHRGTYFAYGPAFGNNNYGKIMYLGGHSHDGNGQDNIAAVRASLNFYMLAAVEKTALGPSVAISGFPNKLYSGSSYPLVANITNGTPAYTYLWSTTCAGATFSSTTAASPSFYIPTLPLNTDSASCQVSVKVTDACGRVQTFAKTIKIYNLFILPENSIVFKGRLITTNTIQLDWDLKGYANINFAEVERSGDNGVFEKIGLPVINSNSLNTFYDNAAAGGNNIYRLVFHTNNGQVLYSKSISIKNMQDDITVSPNPFNGKLVIGYKDINSKNICVVLYNSTGIEIYKNYFAIKNTGIININQFNGISTGLYLLSIFNDDGNRIVTKKLLMK